MSSNEFAKGVGGAQLALGPIGDDEPRLSEILGVSFGYPPADTSPWLDRAGREHVRVLRRGARPVGCLLTIPMGQFFGGRSVPMVGIAGVGVPPEERSSGVAAALMTKTLEEQHAGSRAGTAGPLSTLYPATQVLYRRVGYEQAATHWQIRIENRALLPDRQVPRPSRELELRPVEERDWPHVVDTYRAASSGQDGYLDRGPYIWNRITSPRQTVARGYVLQSTGGSGPGGIEGYVYVVQDKRDDGFYDLRLTDLCATTPEAHLRILRFLYDHRSFSPRTSFSGSAVHPLLSLVEEQRYEISLRNHLMLRVVDVAAALQQRGYARSGDAELHLDVADDVLPGNRGRWRLTVAGGRASVEQGGTGGLRLDVRALASLYSGFMTPQQLRLCGRLDGADAEIAAATRIFAGPAPALADFF